MAHALTDCIKLYVVPGGEIMTHVLVDCINLSII